MTWTPPDSEAWKVGTDYEDAVNAAFRELHEAFQQAAEGIKVFAIHVEGLNDAVLSLSMGVVKARLEARYGFSPEEADDLVKGTVILARVEGRPVLQALGDLMLDPPKDPA